MQDRPRFLRGIGSFYAHWLAIEGFGELARDDAAFTTELVKALGTSLLMSATQLYTGASPSISALFSGGSYFLDGGLRAFYGKGNGGPEFVATELAGRGPVRPAHPPGLDGAAGAPAEDPPHQPRAVRAHQAALPGDAPPGGRHPAAPRGPGGWRDHPGGGGAALHQPVLRRLPRAARPSRLRAGGLRSAGPPARQREWQADRHLRRHDRRRAISTAPSPGARSCSPSSADSPTARTCFAQEYFQFAMTGDAVRPVADDRPLLARPAERPLRRLRRPRRAGRADSHQRRFPLPPDRRSCPMSLHRKHLTRRDFVHRLGRSRPGAAHPAELRGTAEGAGQRPAALEVRRLPLHKRRRPQRQLLAHQPRRSQLQPHA